MTRKKQKLSSNDWPCPESDGHQSLPGAVLLSDEIEYYATNFKMIYPFDPDNLKPAGIYLHLGPYYSLGGENRELEEKTGKDELKIPPFEVAIIKTLETINLPRFIIARWNLRVTYVYKGLLWTGALQVDPGWLGQLPCPIYNLSNKEVTLRLGDKIVLMDFVKTTQFRSNSKPYMNRPGIDRLQESYELKSALYTEAGQRLNRIEKNQAEEFERNDNRVRRIESIVGLVITSIAILFAALAILVTSGDVIKPKAGSVHPFFIAWPCISIAISIFALFIALSKPEWKKTWQKILLASFFIVFSFLFALLAILLAKRGILSLLGIS
jgi:deoxycytidine triphosphate deaminase